MAGRSLLPSTNRTPKSYPSLSSSMDARQLVDSLTSHISLYQRSSSPNPNPSPRSSVLRWFSSLAVDQRQAYLTVVDPVFVQILLRMQANLRSRGHGFFFVLPDLPSRDRPSLPSLCFRKSQGLLARASERNDSECLISSSVRLFGSKEGETVRDCSCSAEGLDSVTVCEDFVADVDRFVEVMDGVSDGGFLRGEEGGLGLEWVELKWLKAKGYYSVEAFVANRLEVALRLAWLNCGGVKKRGVKFKEKANAASAGVAVNVFRRKKGCIDWWAALDAATKRKVFMAILGKAAKSLTAEILREAAGAKDNALQTLIAEDKQILRYNASVSSQRTIGAPTANVEVGVTGIPATVSGQFSPLPTIFNELLVLQKVLTLLSSCQHSEFDKERIFFSTLGSVCTILDCILRKLRGFIMVMSLDWTKLELMEERIQNFPQSKIKGNIGAGKRRKKGRTAKKKKIGAPAFQEDITDGKYVEDQGCTLAQVENVALVEPSSAACLTLEKNLQGSAVEMEHVKGLVDENVQSSARKHRRGKIKNKSSSIFEEKNMKKISTNSASSGVSRVEARKFSSVSGVQDIPNDKSFVNTNHIPNSHSCNSIPEPTWADEIMPSFHGEISISMEGRSGCDQPMKSVRQGSGANCSFDASLKCEYATSSMIDNGTTSNTAETLSSPADCNVLTHVRSVLENANVSEVSDSKLAGPENPIKAAETEVKTVLLQGKESRNCHDSRPTNSVEFLSYEWPCVGCVAPVQFQTVNSQLPAATDRLHLDVGLNWYNHFHQPLVPAMHQARNPPIEGSCNRFLSRQLPMSLDWPPMVRSINGLAPSMTCNYDSGFTSRGQSTFWQGFTASSLQLNATVAPDVERKYSGDFVDMSDLTNAQELADDCDSHWLSEEELEMRAVSGMDYNQYFGGGVMYWNPSDHPGTGFSRPPSHSSDDSSWAWREADMSRAVDDMVAFSSSYSTNGLASPTATPFCSSFDTLGSGHQALGYVMPANEVTGKVLQSTSTSEPVAEDKDCVSLATLSGDVEGKTGDALPYPILRPIIIPNMSRERSKSEFRRSHDHKSPCVPPTRQEQPRIKRPPSPVVLCVPRAPRPPPPSPVSDSRKHKCFPTVRSGSSSPRHWGMRGWYQEGGSFEEACVCMDGTEVVWPSWRNKNISARSMIQPLPGSLLQDRLMAISQLTRDQEHPDVALPLQPADFANCSPGNALLSLMQSLLHDEIDSFCKRVAEENMIRKPYINWAVKKVTRSLQVLWPRSRTNIFGSNATGLSLPSSDVDLVVCLPPVRNLEPIKEAGILEGRNGIKETCLQHAARYLANQEWVKNDSLKTVENTAIPIIMLVVEVPHDLITAGASTTHTPKGEQTQRTSELENHVPMELVGLENSVPSKCSEKNSNGGNNLKAIRLDISFKSSSHTGLQTAELVKELSEQFPAAIPLALVLKKFLADRSLDQSYSGGLSSYCLVLMIIRFLQHEHHLGRPINQNYGSLVMDFLYFFGNVFDPRQMRISVQGSGVYINRERGCSIDPVHIDDPLFPTNNVGRNCFRIHQCIKAFQEAFAILENELACLPTDGNSNSRPSHGLLHKIIPSIDHF